MMTPSAAAGAKKWWCSKCQRLEATRYACEKDVEAAKMSNPMTPEPAAVVEAQRLLKGWSDHGWLTRMDFDDHLKILVPALADSLATYAAAQRQAVVKEKDEQIELLQCEIGKKTRVNLAWQRERDALRAPEPAAVVAGIADNCSRNFHGGTICEACAATYAAGQRQEGVPELADLVLARTMERDEARVHLAAAERHHETALALRDEMRTARDRSVDYAMYLDRCIDDLVAERDGLKDALTEIQQEFARHMVEWNDMKGERDLLKGQLDNDDLSLYRAYEDMKAHLTVSEAAREQAMRVLEELDRFDLSPTFDAKGSYTKRKAEELAAIKDRLRSTLGAAAPHAG